MSDLSLDELIAQHEALAKQIAEIKATKKAEVVEQIKKDIAAYGLTVTDLFDWQQDNTPKRGRKAAGDASSGAQKEKLPPKYRHPQNHSLTWSGRGKHPAWFDEYIAGDESKTKELLIGLQEL